MSTLLVGYDLNGRGRNYDDLIEYLKAQGPWWHHLDSTWLIKTSLTPAQMRDSIKQHVDNDKVLVVDISGDLWSSWGLSEGAADWLKEQVFA